MHNTLDTKKILQEFDECLEKQRENIKLLCKFTERSAKQHLENQKKTMEKLTRVNEKLTCVEAKTELLLKHFKV